LDAIITVNQELNIVLVNAAAERLFKCSQATLCDSSLRRVLIYGRYEQLSRLIGEMLNLSRSVYRYQPDMNRDLPVITAIQGVLEVNPGYGFGKLFKTLRRRGDCWNHKRVYRVYCQLKLNKRRKGKRRLPSRHPEPLSVPPAANCCWSIDFMSDGLMCGRRFRTFNNH
jgi:PAS domain-containing protein